MTAPLEGFRKQACEAYMQCATYLQVKLPLDNEFLRAASSIDPTAHGHHLCTRMLKRLKDLVPCNLSDDERQGFDLEVHQLMVDQNLPAFSEPEGDRVDEWWAKGHATQRYKAVSKVALAVGCVFHGPRIESSFNTMGDIIHSKSANTKVETYAAVQGIKYNLKARNATAIKLFGKSCPAKDPVDRQMCINIRQSSGVYRRIVDERRVEQQRKQKLMGLNKSMQSKKAAKMAMEKKAKEERLCHIRKQQRKSRLRALISSALWHFFNHGDMPGLLRDKKKLRLFSDSCYGQNKNINMLSKLFDLRKQKQLVLHISYYFPVRGHSFLPADRVFGRIGQQLKKLDTVLMPEEYLAVLRNHGTVHTYGEDWEAFDYKNEVKRFTKTQRGFKISEAKALEIK